MAASNRGAKGGKIERVCINGNTFELYKGDVEFQPLCDDDVLEEKELIEIKIHYWDCAYQDPNNELNITYGCKHSENTDRKCNKNNQLFGKECECKLAEKKTLKEEVVNDLWEEEGTYGDYLERKAGENNELW